jgi:hypothetical protein
MTINPTQVIDAIHNLLSADTALSALIAGGVYRQRTAPEISRQYTPAAFDSARNILPTMMIRLSDSTPIFGGYTGYSVEMRYWEKWNYTTIEAARERVRCLLHKQIVAVPPDQWVMLSAEYRSGEIEDTAIDYRLLIDRYQWIGSPCDGC